MSTYKIELKSSKRECKCRGTCKGIIHEDELRIASISDPAEGHSVAYWKHLACMTPTVISNIIAKYDDLDDMPGFDVAGMREAWQCALADGNKAQIMDAFRAQQFSAEGFEPGEKLVEAAPKKDAPKKDAPKKAAAKKAAPKKAAATSEPKKRGRPKKTDEAKPKPKKAKAEPKQLVAPKTKKSSKAKVWDAGPDPYGVKRKPPAGINDGGRRSGRHADDPAEDIDTDGFFVSPSALPA